MSRLFNFLPIIYKSLCKILILGIMEIVWLGGGRHSLNYYDVICVENLFLAWEEFRKGKRAKSDVAKFELNLEESIFDLHKKLLSGNWEPDPYQVFFVQDPKLREIHKASVRDRILYQAVYRKLYQIFDRHFVSDSYSSRKEKGTHKGVERLAEFSRKISKNHTTGGYVLKCDIRKFFDSIDHKILLGLIADKIDDQKLFLLIQKIVSSFEKVAGKGLPLGNVTSQLFANIYLNELDQFIKHSLKAKFYARYCDDFVVGSESFEYLKLCLVKIQRFCGEKLSLEIHPRKIFLQKINRGVDFLGYVCLPHRKVLRTKTKRRMLNKIDNLKFELTQGKITKEKFEQSVQSYFGVLSHCKGDKIKNQIERIFFD